MAEISRKDLILALLGAGTNPRIAGVDLSALDMTRLNLEGSNLRGANMMACTCRETILRSTNMTGVDCTTAQMPHRAQCASYVTWRTACTQPPWPTAGWPLPSTT